MDNRTPIEKMRYDLAGADKARKAARLYDRMHDLLKRDGKHTIGAVIRSRVGSIFGQPERTIEIVLTREEATRLAEWFYERREQEHRRAAGYEAQAIRDAQGSGERWSEDDG